MKRRVISGVRKAMATLEPEPVMLGAGVEWFQERRRLSCQLPESRCYPMSAQHVTCCHRIVDSRLFPTRQAVIHYFDIARIGANEDDYMVGVIQDRWVIQQRVQHN
jgi:hypothetical protein